MALQRINAQLDPTKHPADARRPCVGGINEPVALDVATGGMERDDLIIGTPQSPHDTGPLQHSHAKFARASKTLDVNRVVIKKTVGRTPRGADQRLCLDVWPPLRDLGPTEEFDGQA